MTILVVANALGLTAQLAQVCPQPKTPLSFFHNICTVYIRSPQPLDHVNGWLLRTCTPLHMRAQPHSNIAMSVIGVHGPICTSIAASVTGVCGPTRMTIVTSITGICGPLAQALPRVSRVVVAPYEHSQPLLREQQVFVHAHTHTTIPSLLSPLPPTLGHQP